MAGENDITVKVGGKIFGGWKSAQVTRGIDALVGSYSLNLSERWPGQPEAWGIGAGDECQVLIGGELVCTGYVDQASYGLEPRAHPLSIAGMEKTEDLTDCSAIHKPGSWKNRKLEQIASDLTGPFKIAVKAVAPTGAAFPKFALQQGETVFDALERMARQRGVLPVTTAAGDVELIVPGKVSASYSLVEGENVASAGFVNDISERFSEYLLKGDSADGQTRPKATAKDAGIARYRPLLIVHDDDATPANLDARAKYEATTRAGRGQQVTIGVTGWRSRDGQLYQPDRLVRVKVPTIGIDGELLLYSVTYTVDDTGRRSELKLAPKEAFSLEPIPTPTKRARKSTPPPGAK